VTVLIRITKSFKIAVKPLLKRYPSLKNDLLKLEKELTSYPRQGTPLGFNAYKIRLKIASKGKGKSGGARVISIVETLVIGEIEANDEEITVNLITIYDKADIASISDKELKALIKVFNQEK
jgi:mRNA-degrading endonuclease RelE of RelBE toxin-antitoxin system